MKSVISQHIADFLKNYQPFNFLSNDDLITIANACKIINVEKNQLLFKINDPLNNCFYVVQTGLIHLTFISDAEENIIGKCHAGDVFGLRPFFAKNNYQMNAKAREESLVLAIPIDVFKPLMTSNSEILDFLMESFVSNTKTTYLNENQSKMSENINLKENQQDTLYFQNLDYNKNP